MKPLYVKCSGFFINFDIMEITLKIMATSLLVFGLAFAATQKTKGRLFTLSSYIAFTSLMVLIVSIFTLIWQI